MICCTRYVHNKLIKVLRMHYGELIWKFKEHERKKKMMVDDYILNIVLDKIKK